MEDTQKIFLKLTQEYKLPFRPLILKALTQAEIHPGFRGCFPLNFCAGDPSVDTPSQSTINEETEERLRQMRSLDQF